MLNFYASPFYTLLALLLVACGLPAVAQATAWQSAQAVATATATALATDNYSEVTATAVDAAGNVYLAGSFTNSVVLGNLTLTSLGNNDIFIAKFNPSSHQFVWAQRAGGPAFDRATALAVSGNNVYVTGGFEYDAGFGSTTLTSIGVLDVFVTKLTDAGNFVWAQRAGGTDTEHATALAVTGTSVYVAGDFYSHTASFGSTTLPNAGFLDAFVAKLSDAGPSGSFVWAQRAGNTGGETINALAVTGTGVYVAGNFDSPTVGFGTATLTNATPLRSDVFVAKLTDAGSFEWAQRAGGMGDDAASGLAVSGNNVYVAGYFGSATADFGVTMLTSAGYLDVFVAKLTDAGGFVWAQRAGGTDDEQTNALVVSGTNVYVTGGFRSSTAGFGVTSLPNMGGASTTSDVFVAKLTDTGPTGNFVWAQRAGGTGSDAASGLAVSGSSVYVTGDFNGFSTSFDAINLANPNAVAGRPVGFLASLTDLAVLATVAGRAPAPAQLYPNPARHTVALQLPAGGTAMPLTLTDVLGQAVRHYPAPVGPEAVLDLLGLPAGCYLLHGAGPAQRLLVE